MKKVYGIWYTLYRSGSHRTAAKELARYKLDLMSVQEARWDKGGTIITGDCKFFYGKGNENGQLGTLFCTPQNSISS